MAPPGSAAGRRGRHRARAPGQLPRPRRVRHPSRRRDLGPGGPHRRRRRTTGSPSATGTPWWTSAGSPTRSARRCGRSRTGPGTGSTCPPGRCTPTTPRPAPARSATLLPAARGDGAGRRRGLRPRQGRLRAGLPVARWAPDRVLVARAGLIGGYGDRSDRLGYWPARVARAGDGEPVLVPPREAPVQVIDVEDLARWLVRGGRGADRRASFNAVGDVTTVGAVLEACVAAAGRTPRFVETDDEWLAAHDVEPWMGEESLPLWLPQPDATPGSAPGATRQRTARGPATAPGRRHRRGRPPWERAARPGAGPAGRAHPATRARSCSLTWSRRSG